ncbi:MAG: glutamate--tRNA ligase [bacterium]|nr:glutamate--tRNA ligase [bacterium]
MTQKVRVRFAPSPTGYLHLGGARTALFNWLFARHNNGAFILRIEDTDLERNEEINVGTIISSLKWLGLEWDEGPEVGGAFGPYRQQERLQIYWEYAAQLLQIGAAYYCYCSEEELEAKRKLAIHTKGVTGYDGKCRHLTNDQKLAFESEGRKPTIRFEIPVLSQTESGSGKIVVNDLIREEVEFSPEVLPDFVIIRSDGVAAYNFAVVIDDYLMKITHVIRGEDHLSNTPKQILLYQALGFDLPQFAHLPMILGPDGARFSKRHGATSVEAYQELGYLPEAMINYLALRGWSPPELDKEICSMEELTKDFSLERVVKSPAIFNLEKLNWMNGHYIRNTDLIRLTKLAIPYLKKKGCVTCCGDFEWLTTVVDLVASHLNCLSEITGQVDFIFNPKVILEDEAKEVLKGEKAANVLDCFSKMLDRMDELVPEKIAEMIKAVGKETGSKGKELFMPIRAKLTGKIHGPELPKIIAVLGKEVCLKRIKKEE